MDDSNKPSKESPEENPWVLIMDYFKLLMDYCNKYGATITAIATLVLAILTYCYLQGTTKQRKLLYNQLEYTMSPDIEIVSPKPLEYGEHIRTEVIFNNTGGQTGEFSFEIFFICCNQIPNERCKGFFRHRKIP